MFDLLALLLAGLFAFWVYHRHIRHDMEKMITRLDGWYFLSLGGGSMAGAWIFGSWNMMLSGLPGSGRSILGSLAGAIFMVELYKMRRGIRTSTGYFYALPFCVLVIVGRIGCFLSGLSDETHGIVTDLPWGWDYGDGLPRHPVQLYESATMLCFLTYGVWQLRHRQAFFVRTGFYQMAGFYSLQRFFLEFLKPYGAAMAQLTIFQWLCLILIGYSIAMIRWHDKSPPDV